MSPTQTAAVTGPPDLKFWMKLFCEIENMPAFPSSPPRMAKSPLLSSASVLRAGSDGSILCSDAKLSRVSRSAQPSETARFRRVLESLKVLSDLEIVPRLENALHTSLV